jgi:hypothetical protein
MAIVIAIKAFDFSPSGFAIGSAVIVYRIYLGGL